MLSATSGATPNATSSAMGGGAASADSRTGPGAGPRAAELWRVAAAVVSAPTLAGQIQLVIEAAMRVGEADTATIYLRSRSHTTPQPIARYGYQEDIFGPPRPGGVTEHVLATGEPLVISDVDADPRVNPVVRAAGIRSLVALPLMARTVPGPETLDPEAAGDLPLLGLTHAQPQTLQPVGVLFVSAYRSHAFSAEVIEALQGLAALAAVAIENGYLLKTHRAAAAHLADALRLREQFVSAAAHELKTPLTPLKGYAQAIRRRLDRAIREGASLDLAWLDRCIGIMVDQVNRLDRLITDLLDVSRLRAGRFEIACKPVDLTALAQEVFERFRDTLLAQQEAIEPEVQHTLLLDCRAASLPGVWDRTRLDQLITNLLSNAVKYSPDGGTIRLIVEPADPQDLSLREQAPGLAAGWVHLAVSDQGIGLPADKAARDALFEPFTRGANAPAERFSGFGLGLYICAEIVRRHGGTIWTESAGIGEGATFHVLLPPAPPASPASPAPPASPASPAPPAPPASPAPPAPPASPAPPAA